jgi:alpha-tubulin suppressor-like RCC1 family protein
LNSAGCTNHSIAVAGDGTIYSWGLNNKGQLGVGAHIQGCNIPTQIANCANFISADAGNDFSLALDNSGNVWGFGAGDKKDKSV